MDKIKNSILRTGNFTSSEIYRLLSSRKGTAQEYIDEKNMERRLDRSIKEVTNAKEISWGKLVEDRVFNLLSTDYKDGFENTILHPLYDFWSGSPDATMEETVVEIKCPFTLKSFCQLADCNTIEQIRENHKSGEKYYWQIISNAILTDSKYAELIVYMPYQHELDAIRDMAQDFDGDLNSVAWINWATDDQMPYLLPDRHYKNLNIIRFEIPQSDKDLLTSKVIEAGKHLHPLKELATAEN